MQSSEDNRLSRRERFALALLAGFAISCMIAAVAVTSQVVARIGSYGTASDDNLQWTISQVEVDQLKFRIALEELDQTNPASLAAARQRFDLLYSRAVTLRDAPSYRDAMAQSETAVEVARVITILDDMIPVIDGDDTGLIRGRAALATSSALMTPAIRRIAAEALAIGARNSEAERARLTTQIITLTGLSVMMLVALVLLLALLWRLYRGRLAAEAAIAAAREQTLASERMRARFLGMTSHEMRTPLNGLLGALELLEDSALDPEQRGHARIMRQSGEALRSHIDEALAGLDPRDEAPVLRPAPFDLDDLLADLVAAQKIAAEARGNTLSLAPPCAPLGYVTGDARRLAQVLLNLLANAVKFTRDGTIILSARRGAGNMVAFAVHDTGIGIDPDAQAAIFEDFIRLDGGAQRNEDEPPSGTGLGLGIARRLVSAMGGRIEVESHPGAGSTFTVRVPLPASPDTLAPLPEAGTEAPAPPRPLRVMLAEDNPASRTVTEMMLARDGHILVTAQDGLEALRAAEHDHFDLILMDVDMPRLDGIETTRRIRESDGPNAVTPIAALTAWHDRETVARLRGAGADTVAVKPLSRAALRALLSDTAQQAPLLDSAHVAQMRAALPPERLAETLEGLAGDAEALIACLASGTKPDSGDLRSRVHRLAGTAGACGATALHARLARIEAALSNGDVSHARDICAGLSALWARTRAALRSEGLCP